MVFPPFLLNELPLLHTTSQLVRAKAGLGELFINCVRIVHVDQHVATKYSRELVVARATVGSLVIAYSRAKEDV
jgi:hypothetical protein